MISTKPVSYIPQSPRLLDQLREVLRDKHYSLRTEEAYLCWVKFVIRWHGRNSQVRHPREMGAAEVGQFLTMRTTQRNVSVSTVPGAEDDDTRPGTLVRLQEGDLPRDKGKRKKAKPDLETLAQLPPLPGCLAGALLALGSGFKLQRETGVLLALDVQGVPVGAG